MMRELARKNSAELVTPSSVAIVTGRTHFEVAKRVAKGIKRGQFAAASEIVYFKGGYAAKCTLIPAPRHERRTAPVPRWANVAVRVALALSAVACSVALLLFAVSALLGAVLSLPWLTILGAAAVLAFLAFVAAPSRSVVEVIVRVFIR